MMNPKKLLSTFLKQSLKDSLCSNSDGIHSKGYERFQSLLSQLEFHGAGVSTEDANQNSKISTISAWLQVSLIMRNIPGIEVAVLMIVQQFKSLKYDCKELTASSSNLHNHKNKLNINYIIFLLAIIQAVLNWDHVDLGTQVDEYDLKNGLKWQGIVASGRDEKALTGNTHQKMMLFYALMANNNSRICHTGDLVDASVEIKGYTQGLKMVEAKLVAPSTRCLDARGTTFGTNFELDGSCLWSMNSSFCTVMIRRISAFEPFGGSLSTFVVLDANVFPGGNPSKTTILEF
ncbi:hypothetical protein Tco_1236677 [Tanacetum coccineum]